MKKLFFLATIAISLVLTTHNSAQTIANGSFEDGVCSNGYRTLFGGSNDITGWLVTGDLGNSVDYICGYWGAAEGDRSIDLSGLFQAGGVSQTFATIPGLTYEVTFDMSGNPDGPRGLKEMTVSIDNGAQAAPFGYDTLSNGNTHTNMLWTPEIYYFIAGSPTTTLTFETAMTSAWGPALDNVAIASITSLVCHRNNGRTVQKTLIVGPSALPAHVAHGDTLGACQAPE